MFLGERKSIIQTFILSDDDTERAGALEELLRVQTEDFASMMRTMDGRPMVIRLIDPPLHEFLDSPRELDVAIARLETEGSDPERVRALPRPAAPHRRDERGEPHARPARRAPLRASTGPACLPMQVRAIARGRRAASSAAGLDPRPEIMVPLVALTCVSISCRCAKRHRSASCAAVAAARGVDLLRRPRRRHGRAAARLPWRPSSLAAEAGLLLLRRPTTSRQTTVCGFSRDDAEAKFIPAYLHRKILAANPFETVDDAVLELVRMAVDKARAVNPGMHFGVCGEHGGDPASIVRFLNEAGVDYVSCSPYRVPQARLAAAHAVLARTRG